MTSCGHERSTSAQALAAVAGLAFVGLLVAARHFAGTPPAALTTPPHLVRAFYAVNRTNIGLATYLAALGLTAFICFLTALKSILTWMEGEESILPPVAFAGGMGLAVLALVGDLFLATLAFRASSMDTQTAWILFTLWNMALTFTAFPAAILVGAASVAILRSHVLPRWLGVLGFPLATAFLVMPTSAHHTSGPLVYAGDYWLPAVATFLLWVLAISVSLGYYLIQAQREMAWERRNQPVSAPEPWTLGDRGSDETRQKSAWVQRTRLFLLVTVLVCAGAITHRPAGTNAKAVLLLSEMFPQIPIKPLGLITPRPSHEVVSFTSAQGPIVADLYLPRQWSGWYQLHSRPALILALGVNLGPSAKQAIRHFAESFSRLGYVTLWPRGKSLDRGAMGLEHPATFVAGFRYVERVPLVNPQRISYLGFSAGASEAFVAATDPRIARHVHTVIFFGGYYDLPAYLVSLAMHQITVGGRETAWQPSPAFIAELKTILRSSHEKSLLKLFTARTATTAYRILRDVGRQQQALLHQLSPSRHVRGFRSTVFILHDQGDPIVPWVESAKLAQVMPRKAVRAILWSNLFHHVIPGTGDWRELPLEYAGLYGFISTVLDYL